MSATFAPALLPVLAIAAPVAGCALVLANRRSVRLAAALAVTAAWLCIALPSAILLAEMRVVGLAWLGGALFLLPLILVPRLYFTTFFSNHEPRTTNHGADGGPE